MKFTSYIWDFDGTLFDSYPHTSAAFEAILDRDHIPYDHKTVLDCLMVTYKKARELAERKKAMEERSLQSFTVGQRVEHPVFGTGTVLSAKSMSGDMLYEVAFDTVGTKKLMGKFAKMKGV